MSHYVYNIHKYMETIKHALKCASIRVTDNSSKANFSWLPYDPLVEQISFKPSNIFCFHGGTQFYHACKLLSQISPEQYCNVRIMTKFKHEADWLNFRFPGVLCTHFLGKYVFEKELFKFDKTNQLFEFIYLSRFDFNLSKTYDLLNFKFGNCFHWFGAGTNNGFVNDIDVLRKAKFTLFIKQGGYICNSVVRSICSGTPVIIKKTHFQNEYSHIFPRELFIICDEFDDGIVQARALTHENYLDLAYLNFYYAKHYLLRYSDEEITRIHKFAINDASLRDNDNISLFNDILTGNIHKTFEFVTKFKSSPILQVLFSKLINTVNNNWAIYYQCSILSKYGYTDQCIHKLQQNTNSAILFSLLIDTFININDYENASKIYTLAHKMHPHDKWINHFGAKISAHFNV